MFRFLAPTYKWSPPCVNRFIQQAAVKVHIKAVYYQLWTRWWIEKAPMLPFLASSKWTHKQQARLLSILLILYISCFISIVVDKSWYLLKLYSDLKLMWRRGKLHLLRLATRHWLLIEVIGGFKWKREKVINIQVRGLFWELIFPCENTFSFSILLFSDYV